MTRLAHELCWRRWWRFLFVYQFVPTSLAGRMASMGSTDQRWRYASLRSATQHNPATSIQRGATRQEPWHGMEIANPQVPRRAHRSEASCSDSYACSCP